MEKFTRIKNDVLETIYAADFSKAQYKALLYIIRKIYGWNKKSDVISVSKMAAETGQRKQTMINAINSLEKMGVISVERSAGHPSRIRLEEVRKWVPVTKTVPVPKTVPQGVRKSVPQGVPKTVPTKDTLKDTLKEKNSISDSEDGWHVYSEAEKEELRKEGYEI